MLLKIDGCPLQSEPFPHQLAEWRNSRDKVAWAIFWEQGTGKTKLLIDTIAWLALHGKIDAAMIFAPNGVHRNFVTEEMPKHWPRQMGKPATMWFRTDKAGDKEQCRQIERLIAHPGMAVLAMSYDGILQETVSAMREGVKVKLPGGRAWAKRFLVERRCLLGLDESSRIKGPKTKRTILCTKASAFAHYTRILNGTPVPNGPFDIYSQIKAIDRGFWERHGIGDYDGFKTQFGRWKRGYVTFRDRNGNEKQRSFPMLVEYTNLNLLNQWLGEISCRVTKNQVLDLPPKLYSRMGFELTRKQRAFYDSLRDECFAFLRSGEVVTAPLAITKALRLRQAACGFIPVDGDDPQPLRLIDEENPRIELLREIVRDLPHQAIVWSSFHEDARQICAMLAQEEIGCARYDGTQDDDQAAAALDAFHSGKARILVGNPAKGSEGLTLTEAKTVIYYNNSFNWQHRAQSEDRAHRIGQDCSVHYIDIIGDETVDQRIIDILTSKKEVSAQITGDAPMATPRNLLAYLLETGQSVPLPT